jgi:hypothetical protein
MEGEEIAMTMKPTKGGKRPGSGRKPLATGRKVTGSVNLHPDNWKRLKHAAKAQGDE